MPVQASFASLTALLSGCLGPGCEEQDLPKRLAAIQARAAARIVADVQASMTRGDKLVFAVAAAGALQRCRGCASGAEWDALVQPAAPVRLEQVRQDQASHRAGCGALRQCTRCPYTSAQGCSCKP